MLLLIKSLRKFRRRSLGTIIFVFQFCVTLVTRSSSSLRIAPHHTVPYSTTAAVVWLISAMDADTTDITLEDIRFLFRDLSSEVKIIRCWEREEVQYGMTLSHMEQLVIYDTDNTQVILSTKIPRRCNFLVKRIFEGESTLLRSTDVYLLACRLISGRSWKAGSAKALRKSFPLVVERTVYELSSNGCARESLSPLFFLCTRAFGSTGSPTSTTSRLFVARPCQNWLSVNFNHGNFHPWILLSNSHHHHHCTDSLWRHTFDMHAAISQLRVTKPRSFWTWFTAELPTDLITNLVDVAITLATTMSTTVRRNGKRVSLALSIIAGFVLTIGKACHVTNPNFSKPDPSTYRKLPLGRQRWTKKGGWASSSHLERGCN